jgi:hypothetical protein
MGVQRLRPSSIIHIRVIRFPFVCSRNVFIFVNIIFYVTEEFNSVVEACDRPVGAVGLQDLWGVTSPSVALTYQKGF